MLGVAVYGSFLVASVIGLGFEAGRDARALTVTVLGSMVAIWLARWWSEVVTSQTVVAVASPGSPVDATASGESDDWRRRQRSRRSPCR